ncbi:MAG: helix-turn-helix domain-containing protein [Bacteroidales bacterium]|nr:helix-turn-helix domain-containing protein [Bacteroidales bacterium]
MANWNKTSTTSERLKEAMNIKHMKQADLAKKTGLSKGGISNYVIGRYEPKADIISKLAKALNCSEMWLWGYDVPMERQKSFPDEKKLTEEEKILLDLFNRVPEDKQQLVLQMIRAALGNL